ncbi:MAG TPA: hydroxyquinol 1,2-dioxygenase [Actinomycetota bacterium]|nr:hydroxyquinol 1,2-dioxygenase [Actinomycetota bacterium]
MVTYVTRFGSLDQYEKGGVEVIDDDPRHYAFSNIFEVASMSKPYEKVTVGKNLEYVLEAIRADGTSEWRVAAHDEFALVMDGEVEIRFVKPDQPLVAEDKEGSIRVEVEPAGSPMGYVLARRGHMTLLPAQVAYRFSAERPGVILLQTIQGDDTIERWAEICQQMA